MKQRNKTNKSVENQWEIFRYTSKICHSINSINSIKFLSCCIRWLDLKNLSLGERERARGRERVSERECIYRVSQQKWRLFESKYVCQYSKLIIRIQELYYSNIYFSISKKYSLSNSYFWWKWRSWFSYNLVPVKLAILTSI